MEDLAFVCDKLGKLFQIDIICIENGKLIFRSGSYNPRCQVKELTDRLTVGADAQETPYLYRDEFHVCYGCMRAPAGYVLYGPMSLTPLSGAAMHRYYRHYGIDEKREKVLTEFLLTHILCITQLLAKEALGRAYSDEELLRANPLLECSEAETSAAIHEERRIQDEELYHHTYNEERMLLDAVREGDADAAVARAVKMDIYLGRLSVREYNHWKNASIVAITLCTRAAIEGGLTPAEAYRLSDLYIQKCDGCTDAAQVLECRNRAITEITERVQMRNRNRSKSNYIEQCKDYVANHYREKICQTDLSAAMGISSSYLSRLFHRETGVKLQDYIVQVRMEHAANLLKYSDESIASIAEYVNFPSQSYMGRVFQERMHMSPGEYRKRWGSAEF